MHPLQRPSVDTFYSALAVKRCGDAVPNTNVTTFYQSLATKTCDAAVPETNVDIFYPSLAVKRWDATAPDTNVATFCSGVAVLKWGVLQNKASFTRNEAPPLFQHFLLTYLAPWCVSHAPQAKLSCRRPNIAVGADTNDGEDFPPDAHFLDMSTIQVLFAVNRFKKLHPP